MKDKNIRNSNNIFVLIVSLFMFLFFCMRNNNGNNKFINEISKYVLGIYLIHDNFILRPYLWQQLVKNHNYFSNYLIVHTVDSIIRVYVGCTIVDYLRIKLLEPVWMKLYNLLEKRINKSNRIIKYLKAE